MSKAFLLYFISRSGSHAVCNWIQQQFQGTSRFHSICNEDITNNVIQGGLKQKIERPGDELDLYTFENLWPSKFKACDVLGHKSLRDKEVTILWLVRDPFNWAASIHQAGFNAWSGRSPLHHYEAFIAQIREYRNETNFIELPIIDINFDLWVDNREYRYSLSKILKLCPTDYGRDTVSKGGGGSSFDSLHYDGRGRQMDVLGRWRQLQLACDEYKELGMRMPVLPEYLVEFSEDYFEYNPL